MAGKEEPEDDDYMGDLSLFLPPENSSASSSKMVSSVAQSSKSQRTKGISWQEKRKIDRERKQREEDKRTMAGTEAAIPSSNVGFKLLQRMGYKSGSALGKNGSGRSEPVGIEIRRSRAGIGALSPHEEKARKETALLEMKKRDEDLMQDFGSRKKTHWRSRRNFWDFQKAEAALSQLENREVVEPEPDGDDEKKKKEEEEEENVTEEDLLNLLMKLRDEHHYCLYCGCKYESAEALETNCPGLTEDDH